MKYFYVTFLVTFLTVSCEINQKDIKPTDEFVKIYNSPDEETLYYALSVLQVPDGFLILCGEKKQGLFNLYPTATLLKINELGEVLWSQETDWLAPAPKLVNISGKTGFVAMNSDNDAHFIEISSESGEITSTTDLDLTMPLAANITENNKLVVLGYNYSTWNSTVSLFNSELQELGKENLSVGEDYVSSIDEHLRKTGYEYPFFIGEWNDGSQKGFFVNCLYNYTLGIKFFNGDGLNTGGWIIVHQVKYAPSSLLHKEGNSYALTRYYNNKNFINPTIEVNTSGIQNFNDSIQNPLNELPQNAKIVSKMIQFGENKYMCFASATYKNTLIINQYKLDEGEPILEKRIDFSDRIEVVDIIQDKNDEGVLVLGRTYITGRYLRPVLVKIPKRHFKTD